MIELSVIRDLVAIFGVIAGFSYYVLTVRNNHKNQELTLKAQQQQLETRQFQLLMQLSETPNSMEGNRQYTELMNMEWTDYDDFEQKYGSDNNPDNYALRTTIFRWFNTTGLLIKNKMIDPEIVYDFNGMATIWLWNKFKEIVLKQRELYNNPLGNIWFEYLYNEMKKIHEKRGHSIETSNVPLKYTEEIRKKALSRNN